MSLLKSGCDMFLANSVTRREILALHQTLCNRLSIIIYYQKKKYKCICHISAKIFFLLHC